MLKALLDTNIIINREAQSTGINQDIGILFKWLDKTGHSKWIHPLSVQEISKNKNKSTVNTFQIKMASYELIPTIAPLSPTVQAIMGQDKTDNDRIDSTLLNELVQDRVDIMISLDKGIHRKARLLGVENRVFSIDSFLEKMVAENPALTEYKVLSVQLKLFAEINLEDPFFDSFRADYPGFDLWFRKKAHEKAYVTINQENNRVLSFLYLKKEGKTEPYSDLAPVFQPKNRLKIGTFKVVSNGVRLGERFLKIVFDNAVVNKVDEIYVTIFDKREEQKRLIELLTSWGFNEWGMKSTGEKVLIRRLQKQVDVLNPRRSFPYISKKANFFLVPIYETYHSELFPDSKLNNESTDDFIESQPHRNALSKVYVSRALERNMKKGDVLIFYRTGGYHKSVVTTICTVEEVIFNIKSEQEFMNICKKRSVFSEDALKAQWNFKQNNRPFVVSILYNYSFPKRANLKTLIDNGVILNIADVPRGFKQITLDKFEKILKLTNTDESFIID